MTTPIRGAAAFAAAVTLSLVLASCGDDATTSTATAADLPTSAAQVEGSNNEADVTFAQGMLPHHRQAVEMAELAPDRTDTPEVLELAQEISAAQEPEILTMTAFLEAWGAEVPAEGMDMSTEMDGMDHGGTASEEPSEDMDMSTETDGMDPGSMNGMMSPEQMTDMEATEGADFDRMFLQMMVEHHEGAVAMAETEVDEGENPTALELAQTIIDTQQVEIDRMQDLLAGL